MYCYMTLQVHTETCKVECKQVCKKVERRKVGRVDTVQIHLQEEKQLWIQCRQEQNPSSLVQQRHQHYSLLPLIIARNIKKCYISRNRTFLLSFLLVLVFSSSQCKSVLYGNRNKYTWRMRQMCYIIMEVSYLFLALFLVLRVSIIQLY